MPKLRPVDPTVVARQQEREAAELQSAIALRRRNASIPLRLARSIEESLQLTQAHDWRRKLDKLTNQLGTGFLYSILGTYGTGKSQLGTALAWKACETTTALFIHAPELFDTIKDVFRGDDGDTVREQLQRFIKPRLLVIDEVNQGLTEADIRYLHRVICQRYDDMTDTLLISNENKPNFQKLVGDRIISRMVECGGVIEATWPSFRS